MLTGNQNIVQNAEVAVSQLQNEARYFDQLASQFPVNKRSLGKHATDCRQVATNIQKKFRQDSTDVLSTSVRTANVFLTEGRRLRLKLRISLLQQEATGLELDAGRWSPLEIAFKSLAGECRELVSVCQTNIRTGSSSEIEASLITAATLYEESIKLRQQQKQDRKADAAMRLLQRVETLKDQGMTLEEKIKIFPSFSNKYKQLSIHCLQAATQLELKAEQGSVNDIEKAILATDHFIERIKLSQEKAEVQEVQEVQADQEDNVVPITGFYSPDLSPVEEIKPIESNESDSFDSDLADEIEVLEKSERVSLWALLSATAQKTMDVIVPVISSTSSFLTNAISHSLRKFVKITERVFMFVVVALVILTMVFVLTYLSGSGFSSIGLL